MMSDGNGGKVCSARTRNKLSMLISFMMFIFGERFVRMLPLCESTKAWAAEMIEEVRLLGRWEEGKLEEERREGGSS